MIFFKPPKDLDENSTNNYKEAKKAFDEINIEELNVDEEAKIILLELQKSKRP